MDCSTPGFPGLHYLPEFVEMHVHWGGWAVHPAISSCHALLLPSLFPASGSFPMNREGSIYRVNCTRDFFIRGNMNSKEYRKSEKESTSLEGTHLVKSTPVPNLPTPLKSRPLDGIFGKLSTGRCWTMTPCPWRWLTGNHSLGHKENLSPKRGLVLLPTLSRWHACWEGGRRPDTADPGAHSSCSLL